MPTPRSRIALLALGLLVTMNGPGFFVQRHLLDQPWAWDGPVVRELFIALSVASAAAIVLGAGRAPAPLPATTRAVAAVVGLFAVWIVATSLWSVAPDITRERSVIYLGLAAFAWVLARTPAPDRRAAVVAAVVVALVASLVAVLTSDAIALDRNDDWRGIFTNRNSLAPVAGIGLLFGAGLAVEHRGRARGAALALVALATVMMLGSGSRTAWLAVAAAGGVAFLVVAARWGRARHGDRALVGAGAVGLLGLGAFLAVIAAMWGETTFTQRRTIWRFVWEQIGERPLHGHGWFTMWTQPEFTSRHWLLGRGSAHDSVLDVWLGAGLIGVVGFVVIVVVALVSTGRAAWRRPGAQTWSWLAVVVFLAIENLTESFVLWFSYNWVLLMAAALTFGSAPPAGPERRTPAPSERASA